MRLPIPILGSKLPNMGTKTFTRGINEAAGRHAGSSLSKALFTATQRRVLTRLFGEPGRSYSISELIQNTGAGSGAVQREVARLAGSGLVSVMATGNQKRYRANPESPIHDELVAIVRKTFGLAGPVRDALAPLVEHIRAAFIYGSIAKSSDTDSSDIDLMLVSDDLSYAEAMSALHPLMEQLGRDINPTLYTHADLRKRIDSGSSFITRVLQQPRIWLVGDEHDLAA